MSREDSLRQRLYEGSPDLVADLHLYSEEAGGRTQPIVIGFGCPCFPYKASREGWDGYPLLEHEMMPGETRRVGFVFLSGREAVDALSSLDPFFLWEGKIIGEARIVS